MTGIYKITNSKGKVYIGQAVNLEKRKTQWDEDVLESIGYKKTYGGNWLAPGITDSKGACSTKQALQNSVEGYNEITLKELMKAI